MPPPGPNASKGAVGGPGARHHWGMTNFRSHGRGALPAATSASLAGMPLPNGILIAPDPEFAAHRTGDPVAWATQDVQGEIAATWQKLATAFATTGLWPFAAADLDGTGRPWTTGESLARQPVAVADTASLLAAMWARAVPDAEEDDPDVLDELEPFDRAFPGLAPGTTGIDDETALVTALGRSPTRLGLVAVERPADALAALGWLGAVNLHDDPGVLSAVLRSWEDRFGAVLVGVGFDTVTLAVQRPPTTLAHAERVAAEQFALCPDLVQQGAGSIAALAEALVGSSTWSLWWD